MESVDDLLINDTVLVKCNVELVSSDSKMVTVSSGDCDKEIDVYPHDIVCRIPQDHPTNGDIILSVFPNAKFHVFESLHSVNVVTDESLHAITFDLTWWFAPYKGE